MDISIHEAERLERRGRRFVAASILAAITIIAASWVGLFAFLTSNSAFGTVEDLREDWIPDVDTMSLDLPDLSRLSELYTADGVLLGKLTERNSQPTPLDEIPNLVIGAVLSAEDAEFMSHGGIDYEAIVRAFVADVRGGPTQGGSTITQQVVKQNFVGNEPTLRRKVAEAAVAVELERRFAKEQILEFYLNSVFFGNNAYGVKAAAQEYFGKDLDQLTIAEAAALPIPIRNPSLYDLRRDSEIPVRARDAVVDQMVDNGYITAEEGEEAKAEPIATTSPQEVQDLAPQVVIAAREQLLNDPRFGLGATFFQRRRALFGCPADDTECEGGGGLRIFTTVDFSLQEQAQAVLQEWFPPGEEGPTGAIAMVDNRTGATVVMASGLEFGDDIEAGQRQYDLATKGRRNPGSSFKPFGLVAALETGIPLNSFWDDSTPQVLDIGIAGAPPWECANAGNNEPGIRTLEAALVSSTNTVFCQVAVEVGAPAIADVAHRLGIDSPINQNSPAIVIGASAVSPLEMASAYSTIANYGQRVENYLIERIEDAEGNVIYQHRVERRPVMNEALMAAVVNTLQQAACCGTGGLSELDDGRPWAGKTGTHENNTDVWFLGMLPQYTTSVWVGYPDEQVPMRRIEINGTFHRQAFGGTVAAPIWKQFMEIVTEDLPVQDFPPDPSGTGVYYATPRVDIPDVTGTDFEEAQEELFGEGLDVDIKLVNSDEPEDTVVAMNPEAGDRVRQGTVIEIEVSNGETPETLMPSLLGQTRDQVNAVLDGLRTETEIEFSWVFQDRPVTDPEIVGQVASTNPEPGATVTKNTRIVVFLNVLDDGG
ncbi:MAG: transglycosylase domain-containing protein [Acidimicrobiia bacterium]|nr:transglycosylase domain-containing protein [Acidimicrobiia bacterium]